MLMSYGLYKTRPQYHFEGTADWIILHYAVLPDSNNYNILG